MSETYSQIMLMKIEALIEIQVGDSILETVGIAVTTHIIGNLDVENDVSTAGTDYRIET